MDTRRHGVHHLSAYRIFCLVVLFILAFLFLFPLYWIVTGAFKTAQEVNSVTPVWWPQQWTMANFQKLMSRQSAPLWEIHLPFSSGLTNIAPIAFKYCTALESLDFPITLDKIGDGAFLSCTELSRVVMPEGVSAVGEGAFTSCPKLEQVIIPKSVSSIGAHAFGYSIGDDEDYTLEKGFKLSVFTGSEGERYARANKISYTHVDKSLKRYAFLIAAGALLLAAIVLAMVLMSKGRKRISSSEKKAEAERIAEESYEKILDDSDEEPKE